MKGALIVVVLLLCAVSLQAQQTGLIDPARIDIPYQKFVLDNGLRLIVHEDHKAPIVTVNVWFHVGSKNEKAGRTGFAHLFEHLMFNGSEHYNFDYWKAMEEIGATDSNGTTNEDRTNYFETVPISALDRVLWLESDRMGHLVGVIDQAKLDEQRGVVQNEKRQSENQPYGREEEMQVEAMYPKGHPYSWTVIGSMEDLDAASLNDVKQWFQTYYGAANAVLVVAGDVNTREVFEKVKKYFGSIPSGPTLARYEVDIAKRTENTRQHYEDRVDESRLAMYWNVAEWGTKDAAYLDLVSSILSRGKTSRLYKKLVYEDQIAQAEYAYNDPQELSGHFAVIVRVKPGQDVSSAEQAVDPILENFLAKGPTSLELQKAKSDYFARFVKNLESIGGYGGKSAILAENEVYGNDASNFKKQLAWIENATVADVQDAAKRWLSDGRHTIICRPFPDYKNAGVDADRTKLPDLTAQPDSSFPDIQTTTLPNGLRVVLASRNDAPTISAELLIDAGFASDAPGKTGLSSLAMDLLDEGTSTMSALAISDRLQVLGTTISSSSYLDTSSVEMDSLKPTFAEAFDLFADIVLNPSFPQKEFTRIQKHQLDTIEHEGSQPAGMALRVFPRILYGEGHAYGQPLTGSGYKETVSKLTVEDVVHFYKTWVKPNNSTLIVAGNIEMSELKALVEKRFAKWPKGDVPTKTIATVTNSHGNRLYLVDRPESQQSLILAGYVSEPYGKISEIAGEALMNIFGADFTSRINMNLREDKHWSYGAGAFLFEARGQRPMVVYAPVQTDKTKESIAEIQKEFQQIVKDKPVTTEEFDRVKKNMVMKLPGFWEENSTVLYSLDHMVQFSLPEDYYKTYNGKVKSLTLTDIQSLSHTLVKPSDLIWVVVGDKEKILPGLRQLGFQEIVFVDADGNPLPASSTSK